MKKRIKIFVIFHSKIRPEYYYGNFKDDIIFVNVDPNNVNISSIQEQGYQILNQYEFKNFIPLGKQYAESEVIYNIYRNPYLIADADYVGFLQYDMDTLDLSMGELNTILESYRHIAFDQHALAKEYNVGYLMDSSQPNKWIGKGRSCYDEILNDYNNYYQTDIKIKSFLDKSINLCSAFLLQKELFNQMMEFISAVIESKKLDIFDTEHAIRMQGGFLERYFGIWLTLNPTSYFHRHIEHVFDTTNLMTTKVHFARRLLNFINRKLLR